MFSQILDPSIVDVFLMKPVNDDLEFILTKRSQFNVLSVVKSVSRNTGVFQMKFNKFLLVVPSVLFALAVANRFEPGFESLCEADARLQQAGGCWQTDYDICNPWSAEAVCNSGGCSGLNTNKVCDDGGSDLFGIVNMYSYTTIREAVAYGYECAQERLTPCLTVTVCGASCHYNAASVSWTCDTITDDRDEVQEGWIIYNPTEGCPSCTPAS